MASEALIGMILELGLLGGRIAELAMRQQRGEDVTDEEIAASKAECKSAVARFDAAVDALEEKGEQS